MCGYLFIATFAYLASLPFSSLLIGFDDPCGDCSYRGKQYVFTHEWEIFLISLLPALIATLLTKVFYSKREGSVWESIKRGAILALATFVIFSILLSVLLAFSMPPDSVTLLMSNVFVFTIMGTLLYSLPVVFVGMALGALVRLLKLDLTLRSSGAPQERGAP